MSAAVFDVRGPGLAQEFVLEGRGDRCARADDGCVDPVGVVVGRGGGHVVVRRYGRRCLRWVCGGEGVKEVGGDFGPADEEEGADGVEGGFDPVAGGQGFGGVEGEGDGPRTGRVGGGRGAGLRGALRSGRVGGWR